MPQKPTQQQYKWLAEYYDAIFEPARAPLAIARRRVLAPILAHVKSACDLACGTGTTAVELGRGGIRMFAVDLSPGMCRLAREKARDAGVPVRVIRGDMRDFRLPKPVDLIVCEADAVNHIPRKADLRRVMTSAARALQPGGYFFFDVNNRLGFERYWTGNIWVETEGLAVLLQNGHAAGHDRAWSDVEWFIREGPLWRRHHERVDEVCWSGEEIHERLRGAGFDEVKEWDAAPFFKGDERMGPGCRTVYLARKGS